jgi:hypothetical protein
MTTNKCFGDGAGGIGRNPSIGEMVRSRQSPNQRGRVMVEQLDPGTRMLIWNVDWGPDERWAKEAATPSITPPLDRSHESWHAAEELLPDVQP